MPDYSHHDKAGNQGDVAKHAALIEVVRAVARRVGKERSVRYTDTHAAFAVHDLPVEGAWKDGIGGIKGDTLKDYRDCSFHFDVGFGRRYLGSSALVCKWLLLNGYPFPDLLLFDTDIAACHDLFDYYALVHEADPVLLSKQQAIANGLPSEIGQASSRGKRVTVVHGDSYTSFPLFIKENWKPDLVLVDPHQIDFAEPSAGFRKSARLFGVPCEADSAAKTAKSAGSINRRTCETLA